MHSYYNLGWENCESQAYDTYLRHQVEQWNYYMWLQTKLRYHILRRKAPAQSQIRCLPFWSKTVTNPSFLFTFSYWEGINTCLSPLSLFFFLSSPTLRAHIAHRVPVEYPLIFWTFASSRFVFNIRLLLSSEGKSWGFWLELCCGSLKAETRLGLRSWSNGTKHVTVEALSLWPLRIQTVLLWVLHCPLGA